MHKPLSRELRTVLYALAFLAVLSAVYGVYDLATHGDATPFYFTALCAVLAVFTYLYSRRTGVHVLALPVLLLLTPGAQLLGVYLVLCVVLLALALVVRVEVRKW